MKRRTVLQAAGALMAAPSLGWSQAGFPNRPIKYIVPVAPGGGSDLIGRALAEQMSRALGQPMVVDNIAGGGGIIACQTTMRAPADGYTLMQGYVATHGTAPATRRVPYDAIRDFTMVGMIGVTPNVLVVNANTPVRTLPEFISYLKKNPGRLSYGSAGAGSLTHLTAELFKQQTDTFMVHIPYRGIAPATTDLIGGQTQAMFPGLAAALSHIRGGRLRPIAVTGNKRHPMLPDVPTMIELGLKGFDAEQWYGVMGPANMPADVVKRLNDTIGEILTRDDFKQKLSAEAVELTPMQPAKMIEYVRNDLARWTQIAKERNINLDT